MPGGNSAQASFRQDDIALQNGAGSVVGRGYVAQRGDSISRLLGTSNPQDVGNFMRANGLVSSALTAGQNYFVPADGGSYGDSTALGQAVLNGDNARLAQLATNRSLTPDQAAAAYYSAGGRSLETVQANLFPSIANARALGIYSGDAVAASVNPLSSSPGAYVTASGGVSAAQRLAATAGTIDSITANLIGAFGYLAGKAIGVNEGDAAMMAAVGAMGGDLFALGAGTKSARLDNYASGLYRKLTPTSTNAGLFEVEQTGKYNYRVVGGGTSIDIDGYRGTTMLEAKYVGDMARSPYVADSGIPAFLREKILKEQQSEFQRFKAVITDPSVPFNRVEVLTNHNDAVPYFRSLLNQYELPGTVRVVPTQVSPFSTNKP